MVAGRAFAFKDPKIIELAKTGFIPVCADDWYQRRRQDAEGEFFRKVADQGPRKGVGGATRQGIYTFTAAGELLEFKNAGQDAAATLEQLQRALKKWNALPAAQRRPDAIAIPEAGKPDAKYSRSPPAKGLIVKVHGRILDRKGEGYVRGECESTGGMKSSRDFLWLTAAEVQALVPLKVEVGFQYELPASAGQRIACFHLLDNTRGEPMSWKKTDVKKLAMTLTVTAANADSITLKLDGAIALTNAKADRGYEAMLGGTVNYNRKAKAFDRFDVATVGEHWGDDSVTGSGCRPGRTPFGIAFGLADPKVPAERVPPQAARDWDTYLDGQ